MGYGRYGGAADARFIVMMIPHHEGAIAMAELALRRARRREIRALAQRIKASQGAEIVQMRRWYKQWFNADVPSWGWAVGYGMGMEMGGGMVRVQSEEIEQMSQWYQKWYGSPTGRRG